MTRRHPPSSPVVTSRDLPSPVVTRRYPLFVDGFDPRAVEDRVDEPFDLGGAFEQGALRARTA